MPGLTVRLPEPVYQKLNDYAASHRTIPHGRASMSAIILQWVCERLAQESTSKARE